METIRFYTVPKVADDTVLRSALAGLSGGYTVTYGIGGWLDDKGYLIEEPQATIEVIGNNAEAITVIVMGIAKLHGESAVLRTVTPTTMEYLTTNKERIAS